MNARPIIHKECRSKPRMDEPVPVRVRGSDASGKAYRFETVTRDLGAGGLSALAPRVMQPGERLSVRIRFVRLGGRAVQAPEIPLRGRVVRVEEQPGGHSMFAVSFLLRNAA